jgi:L-alanine-DL-glutamate epimerase-like enolase superfamily enzyme
MSVSAGRTVELRMEIESHPLRSPFRISGYTFTAVDVVVVTLQHGRHVGRGEAAGVYYLNDTPCEMASRINSLRPDIERGVCHESLQTLLPAGGARNALDCALWELEAKESGIPVWRSAGVSSPTPLLTTWTIGADTPDAMAAIAVAYSDARALKLKLIGDPTDNARICAVRAARPDVWLGVDANQGLTPASFDRLLPALVDADVSLLEQPFPIGREADLSPLQSVVPIAADESIQGLEDLRRFGDLFDVINIKLDKCGGLTEALAMAREVRSLGKRVMVGNMVGTSLAMAPAYVVGQLCDVVDLDGPLLLADDRDPHVTYSGGLIHCPDSVWGTSLTQRGTV